MLVQAQEIFHVHLDLWGKIITMKITNLTASPLANLTVYPVFSKHGRLLTHALPFSLSARQSVTRDWLYLSPQPQRLTMWVFGTDDGGDVCMHNLLQTIPPCTPADLNRFGTWQPLLQRAPVVRVPVPASISIPALLDRIAARMGTSFRILANSSQEGTTYACAEDKALVVSVDPHALCVYGSEGQEWDTLASWIRSLQPASGEDPSLGGQMYTLGRIITTLRNYLELGWKTEDALRLWHVGKTILARMHVNWDIDWMTALCANREMLSDLPSPEYQQLQTFLTELDARFGLAPTGFL